MDRLTAPTGFPQQRDTQMDRLTDFVDQLNAEATAAVPPPTGFPTLGDFNDYSTGALKWKDLIQDMIYQVRSARSYPVSTNRWWILLQCLGMWYVNKRIAAESHYARRQTVTSVYKTDWTGNEQEWAGLPLVPISAVLKNILLDSLIVNNNGKLFYH